MSQTEFLDSNVLLYLISSDQRKARIVNDLLVGEACTISVQVLNEFAFVALRKFKVSWPNLRAVLEPLRSVLSVHPVTLEIHDRGLEISERLRFSLYDSLLLAAALSANCTTFFSEDLQHGQVIDGQLTIRNPFIQVRPSSP